MAAGPGIANCTCDSGLGGDGYICYGSIGYELRVESQLEHFSQFLQVQFQLLMQFQLLKLLNFVFLWLYTSS